MAVTALLGGTFNPFHIGHYQMLETLCSADFTDEVLVIPDNIPPHKVCDFLASDEDRIEMCRIACEDFAKAEVCLIEFEREGKSYTVDTVRELCGRYPQKRFAVACGGDMIASLDTWHDWQSLFKLTSFIAFRRKGLEGFENDVERMRKKGADITVIDADITEISSTELRKNMTVDNLPPRIAEYIMKRGVYDGIGDT